MFLSNVSFQKSPGLRTFTEGKGYFTLLPSHSHSSIFLPSSTFKHPSPSWATDSHRQPRMDIWGHFHITA